MTHLRLSLVDGATALLQRTKNATYEELIEKLQSRHGHKGQREKMRTELRRRRRKPGETLQELSTDVERLVSQVHRQMTQNPVDVIGGIVDVASLTAFGVIRVQPPFAAANSSMRRVTVYMLYSHMHAYLRIFERVLANGTIALYQPNITPSFVSTKIFLKLWMV